MSETPATQTASSTTTETITVEATEVNFQKFEFRDLFEILSWHFK